MQRTAGRFADGQLERHWQRERRFVPERSSLSAAFVLEPPSFNVLN
jgi:hypothetical protein